MAMPLTNYRRGLQKEDPSPYWNPVTARMNSMQNMLDTNQESLNQDYTEMVLPQYDWAYKAAQKGGKVAQVNYNSALNATQNTIDQANANAQAQQQQQQQEFDQALQNAQNQPQAPVTNPRLGAVLRAYKQQQPEWNARDNGLLGRFGVSREKIAGRGGWDRQALGRDISARQFLNNRDLQKQIARTVMNRMLNNNQDVTGAVSKWYTGSPTGWDERNAQGLYSPYRSNVIQILQALGLWNPQPSGSTSTPI